MRSTLQDQPNRDRPPGSSHVSSEPAGAPAVRAGLWPRFDLADFERAQAGDTQALGRFFDHYFDRVYSVVHRFLGDADTAQDITQDVFLKLRRHVGRLDGASDLAPWIYTVTANACRDHLRSAWWKLLRRSTPLDLHADSPAMASPAASPEQALLASEEEHRVQAAVRRLPADLRMSVILHDFEGLPHEEIARVTGTTHAAARKRHSRALRVLAISLREEATA